MEACERCGLETERRDLLKEHARKRAVCPACIRASGVQARVWKRWFFMAAGVVAGAKLFAAWRGASPFESEADYLFPWLVVGWAFFIPPLVLLHEVGHMAAAWAVGLRVHGIEMGVDRRAWGWRRRHFFLRVGRSCDVGFCYVSRAGKGATKWRRAVMLLGGPATSVVVIGGVMASYRWAPEPWSNLHGVLDALALLSGFLLVCALFPAILETAGKPVHTDGWQLLRLFGSGKGQEAELLTAELWMCIATGRWDEAVGWWEAARKAGARNISVAWVALGIKHGGWAAAGMAARGFLDGNCAAEEVAGLRMWAALTDVYSGAALEEAEAWGREGMAIVPWDHGAQCIWAAVLLAKGEDEEARKWLVRAWRGGGTGAVLGWTTAWLMAEVYRRQGNQRAQRRWERRARRVDPEELCRFPERRGAADGGIGLRTEGWMGRRVPAGGEGMGSAAREVEDVEGV